MTKQIFLKIIVCLAFLSSVDGFQSDFVTYDWLLSFPSSGIVDHIPHWRRLFNTTKVRGFLECGCGYSSAYFMEHAEKVISIEYVTPGFGDDWYQVYLSLYSDRPNWFPMIYNETFRSNSFNNACAYQCSNHKDYALIDSTYLDELDEHFKAIIANAKLNGHEIDVAFVDPGIYIRGDLVKLLLKNNIPVVAAHDTSSDNGILETTNLYGWNKVKTPPNYAKIYLPFGQGTTFWIREDFPEIIVSLIGYREGILRLQENGKELSLKNLTEVADMPYFLPKK